MQSNATTQHARHRKCKDGLELPPTNFSIFTLKNVTWRTYLIIFTVQDCFLFRFVCIELVSLIWFLQIWVAIYVYGITINWSTLIKKLMQTYIVKISGSILNLSTVQFKWHLTRYMTLSIETCIRQTPCFKRTVQHSPRVSAQYRFHCIMKVLCSIIFIIFF